MDRPPDAVRMREKVRESLLLARELLVTSKEALARTRVEVDKSRVLLRHSRAPRLLGANT
jgi:hypothetical protein